MSNLQELFDNITEWGDERGITKPENIAQQYLKLSEEMGELAAAIARNDIEEVKDAMGDIFVVWVMLMRKHQLDEKQVVGDVFNIINARKGISFDGVFIKEKDLLGKTDDELYAYLNSGQLNEKHTDWLRDFIFTRTTQVE